MQQNIERVRRAALMIQLAYKRWKQRRDRREFVVNTLYARRMARYNRAAEMFQALWKGYYCRRYHHSFSARKQELEEVVSHARVMRKCLEEHRANEVRKVEERERAADALRVAARVRRQHHLLGTGQVEGVLARGPSGGVTEEALRASVVGLKESRLFSEMKRSPERLRGTMGPLGMEELTRLQLSKTKQLPPVKGPFRPPEEVAAQRARPIRTGLFASSDIEDARLAAVAERQAEWCKRISEEPWNPAGTATMSRTAVMDDAHERLMASIKWEEKVDPRIEMQKGRSPRPPGTRFIGDIGKTGTFDRLSRGTYAGYPTCD